MAHATYAQLLKKHLPVMRKLFDIHFLPVKGEAHMLLRLRKIHNTKYPLMVVMAGCHGEEPAPVLSIFENIKQIAAAAKKANINVVIYPLVNPWGFDRNIRMNRKEISCNAHWIHAPFSVMAAEAKAVSKDLKTFSPDIFLSMHEDDDIPKGFYFFTFGNRKYEKPLLDAGKKYFRPVKTKELEDSVIHNGVVYNNHDSTAEDMMFHRGCVFSCCSETSSHQNLTQRKRCARDWILTLLTTHARLSRP